MKCYFHMQDFYNSLQFALKSGNHFNLNEDSVFVHAMISFLSPSPSLETHASTSTRRRDRPTWKTPISPRAFSRS